MGTAWAVLSCSRDIPLAAGYPPVRACASAYGVSCRVRAGQVGPLSVERALRGEFTPDGGSPVRRFRPATRLALLRQLVSSHSRLLRDCDDKSILRRIRLSRVHLTFISTAAELVYESPPAGLCCARSFPQRSGEAGAIPALSRNCEPLSRYHPDAVSQSTGLRTGDRTREDGASARGTSGPRCPRRRRCRRRPPRCRRRI